jgi:hypothetical protein
MDTDYNLSFTYEDENFYPHEINAGFNPGSIYRDSFTFHQDVDAAKF